MTNILKSLRPVSVLLRKLFVMGSGFFLDGFAGKGQRVAKKNLRMMKSVQYPANRALWL